MLYNFIAMPRFKNHKKHIFYYLPEHCNLSEDIQQSCLTVSINDMKEMHPVIRPLFKLSHN